MTVAPISASNREAVNAPPAPGPAYLPAS